MKKNNFVSILGEVPALTQNAEGQLRGGFAVFTGDDGIALYNNGTCSGNTNCDRNSTCVNNTNCYGDGNCHDQVNSPTGSK